MSPTARIPAVGCFSCRTRGRPTTDAELEPGPGVDLDAGPALEAVLAEGQALGFLGPGAIRPQLEHALAFRALLGDPGLALDLGSGGGLPGLVLAVTDPGGHWVLLDAGQRRTRFLAEAAVRLGVADRVSVVCRRAEDLGRDPAHRERYDLVVARSFGPPPVTAECASPLVRPGGLLVVSEPPGAEPTRWPTSGLAEVGLERAASLADPTLASFRKVGPISDRFPRRVGVPAKRLLWKCFT